MRHYPIAQETPLPGKREAAKLRLPHRKLLQIIPTEAVLDIKFSPHDTAFLGVAQSLGVVSFYRLDVEKAVFILDSHHRLCDPSILVLALAFSPTSPDHVALTLSSGEVALFSLGAGQVIYQYRPHELEAWTCEFSSDGTTLYSGGDDSMFCAQSLEAEVQLWRDRKTHQAGVTAILAREAVNNTILTGSYDEWLRVFDSRMRKVVEDIKLGGGVWRIHARDGDSVLASCMHAGVRIVALPGEGRLLSVVAKFEEHESMNYGSHIHGSRPNSVVSCSFYDKRLCIWSI